ncbi:MAG: methylmalonyl Co-A mutase-associated GTPase MeaB [Bacteroidetes bacterium]|jgi:LAO/AO transport system kinase|nr:methylmalonyl Co-A mutase-associated GTPase MeaB [Bacteroidota bacterium]
MQRPLPNLEELETGIHAGSVSALSRAITLVESSRADHRKQAYELLGRLMRQAGQARRIGITGAPGAGKSTFIEAFGLHLCEELGLRVAVLAIDPSSRRTGGAILGDKTRMELLSRHPNAYIRPSAASDYLGGTHRKTREAMLLCEAAGYEVIIVETVGVGQSETAVSEMVDFFLLLMLAGAGDELQGIKRGIMEMADAILITKADGHNLEPARKARLEYQNALHLFPTPASGWRPVVHSCSALDNTGIADAWKLIQKYYRHTEANGYLAAHRQGQLRNWFRAGFEEELLRRYLEDPTFQARRDELEARVLNLELHPHQAALMLLNG